MWEVHKRLGPGRLGVGAFASTAPTQLRCLRATNDAGPGASHLPYLHPSLTWHHCPPAALQDLIEKVNDPNAPEQALIPTSPRSVESCFRLGVDPLELQFHPIAFYKYTGDTDEIARIRYDKHEQVSAEAACHLERLSVTWPRAVAPGPGSPPLFLGPEHAAPDPSAFLSPSHTHRSAVSASSRSSSCASAWWTTAGPASPAAPPCPALAEPRSPTPTLRVPAPPPWWRRSARGWRC